MKITRVAVVGTGAMGRGIAQICAQSGYETSLRSRHSESVELAIDAIRSTLNRGVEKGRVAGQDKEDTLKRLNGVTDLNDLADSDLVMEAVIEDIEEKKKLFIDLSKICSEETIFTSATSSFSINKIAGSVPNPERVFGTHFFDPSYVTKVVEVVTTFFSKKELLQRLIEFLNSLGKKTIVCEDTPGFLLNRIWVPFVLEAIRALESGLGSKQDIDEGMSLAFQHPWGPLTIADAAGLDTIYRVACALYDELKDPKYAPPPLLARMVAAGLYGRKSGKGFYHYK